MTAVEAKKWCVVHRNRNLRTSKALLKSQAHQGTSLFTSAATNQRGFPKGVKRSSGPNSRVPGGDRVAVRVGVVEMGRWNDQKGIMIRSSIALIKNTGLSECAQLPPLTLIIHHAARLCVSLSCRVPNY